MDAVAVQYKLAYIQKSDADLLIRTSTRKFNAEKPSNGLRQVWKSMREAREDIRYGDTEITSMMTVMKTYLPAPLLPKNATIFM